MPTEPRILDPGSADIESLVKPCPEDLGVYWLFAGSGPAEPLYNPTIAALVDKAIQENLLKLEFYMSDLGELGRHDATLRGTQIGPFNRTRNRSEIAWNLGGWWCRPPGTSEARTWLPCEVAVSRAWEAWVEKAWVVVRKRPQKDDPLGLFLSGTKPTPVIPLPGLRTVSRRTVVEAIFPTRRSTWQYDRFVATSMVENPGTVETRTDSEAEPDWREIVLGSDIEPSELLRRSSATGLCRHLLNDNNSDSSGLDTIYRMMRKLPDWQTVAKTYYISTEEERQRVLDRLRHSVDEAIQSYADGQRPTMAEYYKDERFKLFLSLMEEGIHDGLVWVDVKVQQHMNVEIDGRYSVAYWKSDVCYSGRNDFVWRNTAHYGGDGIGKQREMADHCLKCAWCVGMARRRGW